jgi:hypothetical protein
MSMRESEDSMKSQWRGLNTALILMSISASLFLVQIFSSGVFGASPTGEDSLPVSIRAISQADYSRDSNTFLIPPINGNILNQIITNIPATYSAPDRIATLQADLSSPVPTMTSNSQFKTPIATATPRVSPTPTNSSTNTPLPTLPISTIITIPSFVPTNLPVPTIPPLVPTTPPLLPTILPVLLTILPLLPAIHHCSHR